MQTVESAINRRTGGEGEGNTHRSVSEYYDRSDKARLMCCNFEQWTGRNLFLSFFSFLSPLPKLSICCLPWSSVLKGPRHLIILRTQPQPPPSLSARRWPRLKLLAPQSGISLCYLQTREVDIIIIVMEYLKEFLVKLVLWSWVVLHKSDTPKPTSE